MSDEFWHWYLYGHWVCVTQWLGFIMVEYAYLGRGKLKHPMLCSFGITLLTMALSVYTKFDFFTMKTVLLSVAFLILTSLLFGGTMGQKLTVCLINGTMCLLIENSLRYIASWMLQCELRQVMMIPGVLLVMSLANLLVSAGVSFFVGRWRRHSALEPLQALTMSFFPGVIVVLNVLLMLTDNGGMATLTMLVITVGLTIAVMVHLCIVAMFNDQVWKRRSQDFRADLEQQRAEALLDSYTEQRRLTHEFTNHMSALSALLEQGDLSGARDYVAGVSKTVAAGTAIMNTHNPLLDAILSKKYEEAVRRGVSIYFDLCDLKRLPFASTDMVIVLSNLLDNAIRAAAEAQPPEVYVRVRKTEEEYLLSVRNRVKADIPIEEGRLPASTKKERGHGMGLVNVTDILNRYGAEYTVSCREQWFRFTCSLPTRRETVNL